MVPYPARVGRADVASLAVAAALFHSDPQGKNAKRRMAENYYQEQPPFHYTLAMRWAGQNLQPYPPQGRKEDGLLDAQQCMSQVLKVERKKEKRNRRKRQQNIDDSNAARLSQHLRRRTRSLKPYAVCVAIPSYLFLGLFLLTSVRTVFPFVPGADRMEPVIVNIRDVVMGMILKYAPAIQLPRPLSSLPATLSEIFRKRVTTKTYISF